MTTQPLYTLDARMMPSLTAKLRMAMIVGALFVAAMAFIYPLLTGDKDPLISGVFLAVAVFDLGMAVALPGLLSRAPVLTRYAFYADRLDIVQGAPEQAGARVLATLPFSNVSQVEDAGDGLSDKDRAAGFTAVRFHLRAPQPSLARMPYYDRGNPPRFLLRGLKTDENPFARIKDVVEKTKPS